MTHDQFIQNWNGKHQERRDSSNRNQCFDLVVGYIVDVYSLPIDTFSGLLHAHQIFTAPTQGLREHFDLIPNTPTGVPQAGSIIVWSASYNGGVGRIHLDYKDSYTGTTSPTLDARQDLTLKAATFIPRIYTYI